MPIVEEVKAQPVLPASEPSDENMRIAWRYNSLEKVDSTQGSNVTTHNFDLSQRIDADTLSPLSIDYFHSEQIANTHHDSDKFGKKAYVDLLHSLSAKLANSSFTTTPGDDETKSTASKNVMRIMLRALASPLWWSNNYCNDLCLFLIALRALVRNSLSVCMVTIPTHLFECIVSSYLT